MSLYFSNQVQKFLRLKFSKYLSKVQQQHNADNTTFLGQIYTIAENPSIFAQNPALDPSRPATVASNGQVFQTIISGNPQPLDAAVSFGTSNAVQVEEAYRTRNDEDTSKSVYVLLQGQDTVSSGSFEVSNIYLQNSTQQKLCSLSDEIQSLLSSAADYRNTNLAVCTANFSNNKQDLVLMVSIKSADTDSTTGFVSNGYAGIAAAVFRKFRIVSDPDKPLKYKFGYASKDSFDNFATQYSDLNPPVPGGTLDAFIRQMSFVGTFQSTFCDANSEDHYDAVSVGSSTDIAPINTSQVITPQMQLAGARLDLCFGYIGTASNGASFTYTGYSVDTTCPAPTGGGDVTLHGRSQVVKVVTDSSYGLISGYYIDPDTGTLSPFTDIPLVDERSYNTETVTGLAVYADVTNTASSYLSKMTSTSSLQLDAGCTTTEVTTGSGTTSTTLCSTGTAQTSYLVLDGPGYITNITDFRIFKGVSENTVASVLSVNYLPAGTVNPSDHLSEAKSKTFYGASYSGLTTNTYSSSDSANDAPIVIFTDKIVYDQINVFPIEFEKSSLIKPVDSYRFLGCSVPDVDSNNLMYQKVAPLQASGPQMAFTGKSDNTDYLFGSGTKSKIFVNEYKINPDTNQVSVSKYSGKLPAQTITPAWDHYSDYSNVKYTVIDYTVS